MYASWTVTLLCLCATTGFISGKVNRIEKYPHFEDYLKSLDSVVEVEVNEETDQIKSKQDGSDRGQSFTASKLDLREDISEEDDETIKKIADQEAMCCLLGQLAGDKGYHCQVKFYATRLVLRNKNRAHNRKLGFYGREKLAHYGEKMMNKFEKCVLNRAHVFNKCCHIAARETRRPRYNSYLKRQYEAKLNTHGN